MADYKEAFEKNGQLYTKKIIEMPSEKILEAKKGKQRKAIEENVFDLNDSVADNAKMISLLMSLFTRIWEIIPQDQKNSLTEAEILVMQNSIDLFKNTTTWADRLFETEGMAFVEKLYKRQEAIGELCSNV